MADGFLEDMAVERSEFEKDDISRALWGVPWAKRKELFVTYWRRYLFFDSTDLSKVLLLIIMWNVLSHQLYNFMKIIFSKWTSLSNVTIHRLSESTWMFIYYISMWLFTTNYIFSHLDVNIYYSPYAAWEDLTDDESEVILRDLRIFYLLQISFHCFVLTSATTGYSRTERPRFALSTTTYHSLILLFTGFLYSLRYLKLGLLLSFLYDVIGAEIELIKMSVYLEKLRVVFRMFAQTSFFIYTITWLLLTFYLFPEKIIYFTVLVTLTRLDRPLVEIICLIALSLELFNFYQCKNILWWIPKLKQASSSKKFYLYEFFHEKIPQFCQYKVDGAFSDESSESDVKYVSPEAKALVQTVKCFMHLKRKLKRIREEKALRQANLENAEQINAETPAISSAEIQFEEIEKIPKANIENKTVVEPQIEIGDLCEAEFSKDSLKSTHSLTNLLPLILQKEEGVNDQHRAAKEESAACPLPNEI